MSPEAGDPKMTELLSGLKQLGGSGSQTKLTKVTNVMMNFDLIGWNYE